MRNGSEALLGVVEHHHRHLDEAARLVTAANDNTSATAEAPAAPVTSVERRSGEARRRREARFEEAVRLREKGLPIRAVARALDIDRRTVRRWLRTGHAPTWRHADRRRSVLDPFRDHLEARWREGYQNGTGLWREIRERGFPGQSGVVRQWAARRRHQDAPVGRVTPLASPGARPPTARKTARLLRSEPERSGEEDRRFIAALLQVSPPIARAVELIGTFSGMIRKGLADQLDDWIRAAGEGGLKAFAGSIRQDREAVRAAMTMPWSTGPLEGRINRLKVIKRSMYGRAGFDLLRRRVLAAA